MCVCVCVCVCGLFEKTAGVGCRWHRVHACGPDVDECACAAQVRFEELQKSLKEGKGWQKLLRRTAATLRMPTYQVMAARGILPQLKREQSMQLTSTRVM